MRKHEVVVHDRAKMLYEAGVLNPETTVVIANPAARGGWVGKNWHTLAADLRERLGSVQLLQTDAVGHGGELAKQAVSNGAKTIVSFGGDGTHSEICDGIMRADAGDRVALGILHAGTGGDFRKIIEGGGEFDTACDTIWAHDVKRVDVGWVEYQHDEGHTDARHFLNITSLGMSGLVDRYVAESRRPFGGSAAYLTATLRAQMKYKPARVRLLVDGGEKGTFSVSTVCVCNGRWAGGGMMFAPEARVTDGLFDVIVIEATSTLRGLPIMSGLYKGTHVESPLVHSFRGREVEVKMLEHTAWMDIDGEAPGVAPARFEIKQQAIGIIGVRDEFL